MYEVITVSNEQNYLNSHDTLYIYITQKEIHIDSYCNQNDII